MDTVGMPLASAAAEFSLRQLPYTVIVTAPDRKADSLDREQMYVIRQTLDTTGVYHLTVAAKMVRGARSSSH